MIDKQTDRSVQVEENGLVMVLETHHVMEDGEEIGVQKEHRNIEPGADYSGESEQVKSICDAVHTQAVIDAYKNK